jgi:hypothetical protein
MIDRLIAINSLDRPAVEHEFRAQWPPTHIATTEQVVHVFMTQQFMICDVYSTFNASGFLHSSKVRLSDFITTDRGRQNSLCWQFAYVEHF